LKQKKIFVVDCDIKYGQKLAAHLNLKEKHEVLLFKDGNSCIDQLFREPDIVILNCKLEDVGNRFENGLAVLKEIKRLKRDITVIMTSGSYKYGEAAQSISKGAFSFTFKNTYDFDDLDKIIDRVQISS